MPENYITCQDEKGSINISEDVVAAMVRAAITEVDGVAGVATSTGTELAELLGIKSAAKGIKVQIVDGTMNDGRYDHHGALRLQCRGSRKGRAGIGHERGRVHDRHGQAHCERARVRRGFRQIKKSRRNHYDKNGCA